MQLFYDLDRARTFDAQLMVLPPDIQAQVLDKIGMLSTDPAPNAKNKKRLVGHKGNICRIRSGDYRVVYTFDSNGRVSLLGVDHRKDVYRKQIWTGLLDDPDFLLDVEVEENLPLEGAQADVIQRSTHKVAYWSDEELLAQTAWNLPRALDPEFLSLINVPAEHYGALAYCVSFDDLLDAPVPEEIKNRIADTLGTRNYDQVLTEPRYVLESFDDFRRMLEGELVPMLLRLDSEQERHVNWALSGSGPVLLKGAPGTGKSVVAVYRVRSLINALRQTGIAHPRILFTSYTNALINSARHLLNELLGPDAALVDACTADMVISRLHAANLQPYYPISDIGLRRTPIYQVRERMETGDEADRRHVQSIARLPVDYLIEEIDQVIVGRDLVEEDDYVTGPRQGRRVPLNEQQRRAVWRLYELVEAITGAKGQLSYPQTRRTALHGVRDGWQVERYDGVVIDEAQDLSPTTIRLLLELAESADRLFLTADFNQCIYGNGFPWKDVREDLDFRGRTSILRRNFRSTRQIVDAAAGYLAGAEIDEDAEDVAHMRSGPKPVALRVDDPASECAVLVDCLREATRALRVSLTSCAVLVGMERTGRDIAARLRDAGLPAEFMKGRELDLEKPVLTVTTFQSAKGLEFPIVAIAGLDDAPQFLAGEDTPEGEERRMIDRRVLYVAMTRAMYALLVLLPANAPAVYLDAFTGDAWLQVQPHSWREWLDDVAAIEPQADDTDRSST
jgi:superfamily I DNA/RNA helicase/mRNA-degrading endonuclease RelE of RelBE toxin-antitoxin system